MRFTSGKPRFKLTILNHFSTDHLLQDIKTRSARGVATTAISQSIKLAIQIISVAALTRLLTPSDFGLVAMVTVATGLLSKFGDAGLSTATVQRSHITHAQTSNLFWLNILLGSILTAIMFMASPAIAWIYGEPALVNIAITTSISFIISASAVQHIALLRRQMRFRTLAYIEVTSQLSGTLFAIAAALAGLSYWALVGMTLATSVTHALLAWHCTRWVPRRPSRGSGVLPMIHFGAHITGAGLISHLASHLTPFSIGLIGNAQQLGIFNRANTLASMPGTQVIPTITQVAQPSLARIANDDKRFSRAAISLIRKICLLSMFVTVTMVTLADWIVEVALGPAWQETVIYFKLMAVYSIVQPLGAALTMMLTAKGKADTLIRWNLVMLGLIAASVAAGSAWGPTGIVVATSLSGLLLRLPLLLLYASGHLGVRPGEILVAVSPFAAMATLLFLTLTLYRQVFDSFAALPGLAIAVPLSIVTYAVAGLAIRPARIELQGVFSTFRSLGKAT